MEILHLQKTIPFQLIKKSLIPLTIWKTLLEKLLLVVLLMKIVRKIAINSPLKLVGPIVLTQTLALEAKCESESVERMVSL